MGSGDETIDTYVLVQYMERGRHLRMRILCNKMAYYIHATKMAFRLSDYLKTVAAIVETCAKKLRKKSEEGEKSIFV